ncbi:MAG: glycine--tRNA ligase subunit beta, partial [Planctomycetales bacterium]|nr:glycine--tRNA ligase subunit beta [Planctomycetales bacterium]
LVAVMKEQQRYFPVEANGDLLPYFVALRNGGTEHLDIVTQGNENVLEARFADAEYFIGRDLEEPLEAYLPRLASLTFHAQLGSMLEKVHRVETLVAQLASDFDLEGSQLEHALRAAQLCKADLSTLIVREMTSLQGVMGRQYALQAGEPPEVAEAIYEHYLPRTAEDDLPTGQTGIVLGIADRLDTLMGLFATGITPTGGGDPFGLRRAALGLIQVLVARSLPFDLRRGLRLAGQGLPFKPAEEAFKRCLEFIRGRQQRLLRAAGFRHDVVAAVLEEQGHDPAGTAQAAEALGQWTARSDWSDYLNAYARCAR